MEIMRPELDRITGHDAVQPGSSRSRSRRRVRGGRGRRRAGVREGRGPAHGGPRTASPTRATSARSTGPRRRFGATASLVPQATLGRRDRECVVDLRRGCRPDAVAMAPNLTQTLMSLKSMGLFVLGLARDGDVQLDELQLADRPIVIVVGSVGKGQSRGSSPRRATRSVDPDLERDGVAERRHRRDRHPVGGRPAPSRRVARRRPDAPTGGAVPVSTTGTAPPVRRARPRRASPRRRRTRLASSSTTGIGSVIEDVGGLMSSRSSRRWRSTSLMYAVVASGRETERSSAGT